jgi:hypothetical protein
MVTTLQANTSHLVARLVYSTDPSKLANLNGPQSKRASTQDHLQPHEHIPPPSAGKHGLILLLEKLRIHALVVRASKEGVARPTCKHRGCHGE